MRVVGGVVAGLILAFACILVIETIGHQLFPPPFGGDFSTPEGQKLLMQTMPFGAKAAVVVGWFAGALAGAWLADRIARRGLAGWIVAGLVAAAAVANMAMIPHPAWMWAAGIVLPLGAAWLAQRLTKVPFQPA